MFSDALYFYLLQPITSSLRDFLTEFFDLKSRRFEKQRNTYCLELGFHSRFTGIKIVIFQPAFCKSSFSTPLFPLFFTYEIISSFGCDSLPFLFSSRCETAYKRLRFRSAASASIRSASSRKFSTAQPEMFNRSNSAA